MIYTVSSNDESINWNATDSERIAQNVLNLIRTRKREIPFLPNVGLQVENIDSLLYHIKQDIQNEVMELVENYESRSEVLSVKVGTVAEDGDLEIVVELEV